MTIPNESAFALSKVKALKNGGLDVQYEVTEIVGNESYTNKYHVESAKDFHADLRELFDRLRPIMGRIFNITSFLSMIEAGEYKASEIQIDKARNFADELLKNIEIKGISLSGEGDNARVVITALYEVSNGMRVAINSPRIRLSTISFGFEEELETIVAGIESEVYAFLFKGKKAQLELFGENMEPVEGRVL